MFSKFPANGTFSEQKEFVDALPEATTHSIVDDALTIIEKSDAPFNLKSKDLPEGVNVEIFHHGVHEKKESSAAHRDSDDEGEEITGVLTRKVNLSKGDKKEKMVLHVADAAGASSVFAINLNPDGTLGRITHKKQSIEKFKAGLFDKSGVVVKGNAPDIGTGTRFTARSGRTARGE